MYKGLKFITIKKGELRKYAFNPRKLRDPEGIEKLRVLIREHGFRNALEVWKNKKGEYEILCGNHRFEAACLEGIDEFPCTVYEGSRKMAAARVLSDNKSSDWTEYNFPILKDILTELDDGDFDLSLTGFDEDELKGMIDWEGEDGLTDADEIPEVQDETITKTGDLILLGDHRLLCGDSTKDEHVKLLMGGNKSTSVMTDPPYGVEYTGKTRDALKIKNDDKKGLPALLSLSLSLSLSYCLEGSSWYVAAPPGPMNYEFSKLLGSGGLNVWRQTLIWVKDCMVLGRSDYHYRHEPIFYGWKPGKAHKELPDRKQTTVLEFARPKVSKEHPTMKPINLYEKFIKNSTSVGSIIHDPFGGSGTTLLAAERMGRRCFTVEIDPHYCDVIIKRWEDYTGDKAVRP